MHTHTLHFANGASQFTLTHDHERAGDPHMHDVTADGSEATSTTFLPPTPTHTFHIAFTAPDDATAVETGETFALRLAEMYACVRGVGSPDDWDGTIDNWDVSGVDCSGAQDWSVIVARHVLPLGS